MLVNTNELNVVGLEGGLTLVGKARNQDISGHQHSSRGYGRCGPLRYASGRYVGMLLVVPFLSTVWWLRWVCWCGRSEVGDDSRDFDKNGRDSS